MVLTRAVASRNDSTRSAMEGRPKRAAELNPDLCCSTCPAGDDGFGALTGLRRKPRRRDTPVIFLSAQATQRRSRTDCPRRGPITWRSRSASRS